MKSNKFKITMKGDDVGDSLRLSDLIDQLDAFKQTLNQIDLAISGKKTPSLYYRITSITMNSPATFEVEAVPKVKGPSNGRKVVSKLDRDLRTLIEGKRPKETGMELMESYGSLSSTMRSHISALSVHFDKAEAVELPRNLDLKVEDILGPDTTEAGSVVGSLDSIDVHKHRNVFKVYPIVGPSSIKCQFPTALEPNAIAGIKHFVRISGMLHFKKAEKFPHLIKVSKIEVLPERSDAPKLSSLRGIAAGALDGLSSTAYVDKVRNADW